MGGRCGAGIGYPVYNAGTMTAAAFVKKWAASKGGERAVAQEHFIDLCRLLGEATPSEADPARYSRALWPPAASACRGVGGVAAPQPVRALCLARAGSGLVWRAGVRWRRARLIISRRQPTVLAGSGRCHRGDSDQLMGAPRTTEFDRVGNMAGDSSTAGCT